MSTVLVYVVYGGTVALALVFVYLFHARWYWHVCSVPAALPVGFSPSLPGWDLADPCVHRFHRHGGNEDAPHHA